MQKLRIRRFGPIKEAEIDVKDIMLFIGPQASGKSTISKTLYFFKSLRDDLLRYLLTAIENRDFKRSVAPFARQVKEKFLGIYGPVTHFPDMLLEYDYGNRITVKVILEKGQFTTVRFEGGFNQRFQQLVEEVENFSGSLSEKKGELLSSHELIEKETRRTAFVRNLGEQINHLFNDDREIIYLPAGRGLITTMSEQISNIELGDKLDDLMRMFIRQINNIRPSFSKGLTEMIYHRQEAAGNKNINLAKEARKTIAEILHGRYEYTPFEGERLYFNDEGGFTKINYASSGQQESIWILFLIFLLILNNRKVFLVVEEPEAHLYPIAQKQIVDLLSLLANANQNQIIITTHSPYILSSFNNLLYAHTLGQQKEAEVMGIISKDTWIKSDKLDGYMVADGKLKNIMDRESKLLETAAIDSASELILDIFNKLFDLDDE